MEDKDILVRYLLGDLSRSDRERLEKEFMADDQAREGLTEAENDLIDSYACGDLSGRQRQQFEENFLNSPQRNEQLAVARMLMDAAVREKIATAPIRSQKESTGWRESALFFLFGPKRAMSLAVLMAGLVIATLAFFGLQNWRLQNEVNMARIEQTRLQHQLDNLQQQLNNPNGAPESNTQDHSQNAKLEVPALSQVSILLTPGLSRQRESSSPDNRLVVPAGAAWIIFRLDLERDRYARYDVVIETVEGTPIQRIERLASQSTQNAGRCVAVQLPSRLLSKGDYVVTLYGRRADDESSVVDSYSLTVVR